MHADWGCFCQTRKEIALCQHQFSPVTLTEMQLAVNTGRSASGN